MSSNTSIRLNLKQVTFFEQADGNRVVAFIVNVDSVDMIPSVAEPLFQEMGFNVEYHPVKKAVQHLSTLLIADYPHLRQQGSKQCLPCEDCSEGCTWSSELVEGLQS